MIINASGRAPFILLCVALLATPFASVRAEDKPALAPALEILDAGRRAYNENKSDAAVERFREFLKLNAQTKEASAAQLGLGLALLDLPQKDFAGALAAFQQATAKPEFSERPTALYYQAFTHRLLASLALEQSAAKPAEAAAFNKTAADQFSEAAKQFAAAAAAFSARAQSKPAAGDSTQPSDQDWAARSRCDLCDVLLRQDKLKEAADLAQALAGDKALANTPLREQALYCLGFIKFKQKEYHAAGRALSQLAPFQQPFGTHARYLLSRIHHAAAEDPEAAAGYKALLSDFDSNRKAALEAIKNPPAIKPEDRARIEALAKTPPDFVANALFYDALLKTEAGNFGPAAEGFAAFIVQFPKHLLIEEARLRQAFCFLENRNAAEAIKLLQPLQAHPKLADRAMWWLARAQFSAADPNNVPAFEQAAKAACDLFAKAADKASEFAKTDPDAKVRRGDILLELGDTQAAARLYKEAAATYANVFDEKSSPERAEEALQRQATALHLAAHYKESEEICHKFEQTYPKSTLLAEVWFRSAENACLLAVDAASGPKAAETRADWEKKFDDAITRYKRLLAQYPEFQTANLARYGMATAQYQRGSYRDAISSLNAILDADRNGDLAPVNAVLADCLIRLMPAETNDALQAGSVLDKAERAIKFLDKYLSAVGKAPQGADTLLKLGYCYQRIGTLLINPAEKQKNLTLAKQMYEKLFQEFPASSSFAAAVLERAYCIAQLGDPNGAIHEYARFTGDPLQKSPVAPLAFIRQAELLRSQNRAPDAVNTMAQCRTRFEALLQKDPQRSDWVPPLLYEQALAIKDSGKIADARAQFEQIIKQFEKHPEALSSTWRAAQCRRDEAVHAIAVARITLAKQGAKPEELAAAAKAITDSSTALLQSADALKSESAKRAATKTPVSENQLRLFYEAAWCYRALAELEIEAARQKAGAKTLEKVLENIKKTAPPTQPPPVLAGPAIALAEIPVQPAEKSARDQYTALINAAPSAPLAIRARLELAEMHLTRGRPDAALELLELALEDNPAADMRDRIRVALAAALVALNDTKSALVQTQIVLKNPASAAAGDALYVSGEASIQAKDWNNALTQLVAFKDKDPFRNMNTLTERALMRLGFAFAQANRWDESRQSYEQVVQRFGNSAFIHDARFNTALAWQKMNQHDNAYNNFNDVARRNSGDIAARSQLQMGLIRLAQKRWAEAAKDLLVVPIYDTPELSAEALTEAGQAFIELKQPAEAKKALESVLKDFAASKWAETAKTRLATIK